MSKKKVSISVRREREYINIYPRHISSLVFGLSFLSHERNKKTGFTVLACPFFSPQQIKNCFKKPMKQFFTLVLVLISFHSYSQKYIASPFATGMAPIVAHTKKIDPIPVFAEPNFPKAIGQLKRGAKVVILNQLRFSKSGKSWYLIEYNWKRAYVECKYIKAKFFNFRAESRLKELATRTRSRLNAQNHFIRNVAPILKNTKMLVDWYRGEQRYFLDAKGKRIYVVPPFYREYRFHLPRYFSQSGFIQPRK